MSGEPNEEELEKLREQKREQLQDREGEGGEGQEDARKQAEAQKKAMLRKHLTDEARKRLNTVKMSKQQVGEQVEQQIISLAQSGRVQGKIDDDQMRELLDELTPDSKSFDISRR